MVRTATTRLLSRLGTALLAAALVLAAAPAKAQLLGADPLIDAAGDGNLTASERAIMAGSSVNVRGQLDRTALMISALQGYTEIVALLLENKAIVDLVDRDGSTALMLAAQEDHVDALGLLVAAGADLERQDRQGLTALARAAKAGRLYAVRALLGAGARPETSDFTGRTPLDHARDNRRRRVAQELERAVR